MLDRCCSAGCARRASLSRRTSPSSGAPLQRALLGLVLLGVQVLLAARLDRRLLDPLVAGVDPVGRAQRRGEHQPRLERRAAAVLELLGEDVGGVGEEVGAEVVLADVGQLADVLLELPARLLPGEVGVGLVEPGLGQRAHHRATGERLGQEDHVGVLGADLADHPLPEGQRLGVRVVDAEDLDAAIDPGEHDVQQRVPQGLPVLALEVDVVDVLVLLGRVLGVLQRAVGAAVKPLGVLGQPRVVGRALDREVDRDVDARARSRCARAPRSPPACPGRDGRPRGRRRPSGRSPTGCRGRPGARSARCWRPCGWSRRSGGSG